ncbi:exopolysaccharide production protein [Hahella chejuensis KCTC 2396]|uniref:Exopolysaccharide production protein n=1 Tax=Hahella chejuensis (strain KCTC 2396) TaxID=349521 RepID=Q2SD90_HAHCH|nr:O-antigen ligase family protein [Hahella chejuensis]ABC31384.1 exopolysaccharide production protein [Hahella chejuensis KCTC 2396]
MTITRNQLRDFFLGLVMFYYSGFMSFLTGLVSGGGRSGHGGAEMIAESASGNMVRQLVGLSILAIGGYFVLHLRDRSLGTFVSRHIYWLILLGYIVLSILWSVEPGVSVRRIISLMIVFVAALALLQEYTPEYLLSLIARILGCAAIAGLIYAVISPQNGFIQGGLREGALLGIFSDKNAGARCYVYALMTFYGLRMYESRQDKILIGGLVAAIILSNSATALAMVFGGMGLTTIFNGSRVIGNSQKTFNRLIVVTMGLLIGAVLANYFYELILLSLGRDPSLTNRTIIWELLGPSLDDRPTLGYGYGAFWASVYVESFVKVWGFIGNAHSGYVETRLNGGYVGLVILIATFVMSFWRIARAFTFHPESSVFALMASILLIQAAVNYIGFIIPNHVSFDMFMFSIIVVVAGKYGLSRELSPTPLYEVQPDPAEARA